GWEGGQSRRRELWRSGRHGLAGLEALRLGELAQDDVALQGRDVVDEQHAFEVVHLVLDAGRRQPAELDRAELVLVVEVAQLDRRRPLDIGIVVGQRQAAFAVGRELGGAPQYLWIGELERGRLLALARGIDDDDATRHADLRRGEADAGRRIHGLQ